MQAGNQNPEIQNIYHQYEFFRVIGVQLYKKDNFGLVLQIESY